MTNVCMFSWKKLFLVRVEGIPLGAEVGTAYVGGHANA